MAAVDRELDRVVGNGCSPARESALHLLEAGGKRIRPFTVILAAACFDSPPPAARDIAVVAELVHLATLLHDDVIDSGDERRGRPTSRRIWGNAMSVISGDLLLTEALRIGAERAPPPVLVDLLATLRRLVDGEVVQLHGRAKFDASEEVYFRIVRDKTASLFEWAARSGAACVGAPPGATVALGEFGAHVGLAFQLVDDVLDYSGDPLTVGKSLHADLHEGKPTLPLIRALALDPGLEAAVEAVRDGDRRAAVHVARAVRASGVCDSVRELARSETARACAILEGLPPSIGRDILEAIARELAARTA